MMLFGVCGSSTLPSRGSRMPPALGRASLRPMQHNPRVPRARGASALYRLGPHTRVGSGDILVWRPALAGSAF